MKQVLVISHGQNLSRVDRNALEAAGFIVVRVKYPSDVRVITEFGTVLDEKALVREVMRAFNNCGSWADGAKARAFEAFTKLITNTDASKTEPKASLS